MNKEKRKQVNVRPVGILRTSKAGKAHIHKVIIEECGGHAIPYVINASAVLLYDPTLSLESLLASIDVLKSDVKLRVKSKDGCSNSLEVNERIKELNE